MQIKTITCHDVYNAGASLQAYALVTYLKQLGHEAEIIDYKPDYLSNHYSLNAISNPIYDKPLIKQSYLLAKLPGRLKALFSQRKKNFDLFRENLLPLTKRYGSLDELKKGPPPADVYFAGSDQIWNTFFKNGKDGAFYLEFAPEDSVKASYAASFATPDIIDEWKLQIEKWLKNFDYISVRESSGLNILSDLGIEGQTVLDPVFLLSKDDWAKLCKPEIASEKYVLVYDFDGNEAMRKVAEKLSFEFGLKIFTLQNLGYGDKSFTDAGPLEFISLINNASFVLSNSFHATAFSIIFEKQFWTFNRAENINMRMRDLVDSLGLDSRLLQDENVDIEEKIDYDSVNLLLNNLRKSSEDYISNVLSIR